MHGYPLAIVLRGGKMCEEESAADNDSDDSGREEMTQHVAQAKD